MSDHGELDGLGDNDHTQYYAVAGGNPLTADFELGADARLLVDTDGDTILEVSGGGSAVNYLDLNASAATKDLNIAAKGTDSNITIAITAKGTRTVYAVRQICLGKGKTKAVHLHREIIGAPTGMFVDHINHNGLDNRKANLRLATRLQNARNRPKTNKATSSQYKGVSYRRANGKWSATIFTDGRNVHLGYFETEIEAAKTYDKAAIERYGRFAALNLK